MQSQWQFTERGVQLLRNKAAATLPPDMSCNTCALLLLLLLLL
jgi:hypothetical protein